MIYCGRLVILFYAIIFCPSFAMAFCQANHAIFEAKISESVPGYVNLDGMDEQWIDKKFEAVKYGEYFYLFLNHPNGDRRVVGEAAIQIRSGNSEFFVVHWKGIGTPFMGNTSRHTLNEESEVRWLDIGPVLTDEPFWSQTVGSMAELGDIVFEAIEFGPLKGYDLILAGCQT